MKVQTRILQNLDESWIRLGGPKYKLAEFYRKPIVEQLIPMLKAYGIDMLSYPVEDEPGYNTYKGIDDKGSPIFITIYPENTQKDADKEFDSAANKDLMIEIKYNNQKDKGYINLKSKKDVEDAFELITSRLENFGYYGNSEEEKKKNKYEADDDESFVNYK